MPYLQAGSPAARLLGGDHTDIWPFAVRVGAPAILLALAIAAVLGVEALVFTILVVIASALAWTVRRTFGGTPPLVFSLVAVGLPWALTLRLAPVEFAGPQWLVQFTLLTLWVVHQWGETRALSFAYDWFGLALMGIAEIGLCILLIVAQAPLWLALLVVLFLPAWLAVVRQQPLTRMRFFWLAAMLSSALALGQTV